MTLYVFILCILSSGLIAKYVVLVSDSLAVFALSNGKRKSIFFMSVIN